MGYKKKEASSLSIIMLAAFSSLVMVAIVGNLFFLDTTKKTHIINSSAAVSNCTYTTSGLNLSEFNLMLPTGAENNPTEIFQPVLKNYQDNFFFPSADCKTLFFKAPTNGATSDGSDYPRTELRETSSNGQTRIKWSNRTGTHTMELSEAILRVPNGKKEVVVAQVHNTAFDAVVIRLNDKRLFINTDGGGTFDLNTNYILGTTFSIKFVATGGKVHVYYNNSSTPVFTYTRTLDNAFFKAGVYVQSNCATELEKNSSCSADNYGQSQITRIVITHSGSTTPTVTPSKTPTPTQPTSCVPSLKSPSNGVTLSVAPLLTWSSACQKYYQVNLNGGGNDAYHGPINGLSFRTYPAMYSPGRTYTWRVRTCDNFESGPNCVNPSAWSSIRSFYWQPM